MSLSLDLALRLAPPSSTSVSTRTASPTTLSPSIPWNPSTAFLESAMDTATIRTVTTPPILSSSFLHFFVHASSRTLVFHARPDETVGGIIGRICAMTGFKSRDHHLIYRSRLLSEDMTLAECAIEKDTTLRLIGRLLSASFSTSWQIVDEMFYAITCLLALRPSPTDDFNHIIPSISVIVKKFLAMTPTANDEAFVHLQVFISTKAHVALVKLYMSPFKQIREVGKEAINTFFSSNRIYLPQSVHLKCTSILFEFCKLLAGTVGRTDSLYLTCRSTLGSLLAAQNRSFYISASRNLIIDLYPFVAELAEAIIILLPSEKKCLASGVDFSNFMKALRWAIHGWLGGEGFIPESMYKSPSLMCEQWAIDLYAIFLKLVKNFDEGLEKTGKFLAQSTAKEIESHCLHWSNLLAICSGFHKFARNYEDARKALHAILLTRRVPLNALIKLANRNDDYHWLLKLKDITDFESRRKVSIMLFPDRSFELHEMLIDRSQLLTESFEYVGQVEANALHGGLFMEFKNEQATGPGVLREWFCVLCREIFSQRNILFLSCPNNPRRFFPNAGSVADSLHLKYFSFVGRVIALALMHKVQVGITFDRVFFLQLSGKTITLEDIQDADPFLYMSCKKILDMDDEIVNSDALGLTFVRDIEALGSRKSVELCPGGREIVVNSTNRKDYVTLLVQNCFVTSIAEQIHHFNQGFSDIFSDKKSHKLFFRSLDLEDFNRMVGGSDDSINVSDWKAHTSYDGYRENDCHIIWFWTIVEDMEEDQKRTLLRFWTSLRHLPVEGFSGLSSKLFLCKVSGLQNRLPTSQTCFYTLNLPQYSSISIMSDRMQLITQEHVCSSFGLW
ncbi:E3 ubiquitin-protein ligase UPL5 [Platanthera zijinensis]|uniref:HECT-type E3 ubiquitin transferase n=1 Tax=Platanthera zijinensis TaxID=2320716 RepID=A0AAP0BCN4_9ASPA